MSSHQLSVFVSALAELCDIHGFVLIRHGKVIAEGSWAPYSNDEPHSLFSLSKSFTATAIGMAVDEGLLTVDDRVLDIFSDDAPDVVSDHLDNLRVRHLLSMTTGHAVDSLSVAVPLPQGVSWVRGILGQPFPHQPGTHFVYNSGATYVLSAIITKLTRVSLLDYLTPRLFEPLGIRNATWSANDEGVNLGEFGLDLTTEDAAKLGLLYLQHGRWNDQQLLSPEWVAEATRTHASQPVDAQLLGPDWDQGYGYQFWRCQHGFYRGDGAFGQYSIVMETHDAVLATTSGVDNDLLQLPLDAVWSHLLPAFHYAPIPDDSEGLADLNTFCGQLEIALVPGAGAPAMVQSRTFGLQPNDGGWISVTVDVDRESTTLQLTGSEGVTRLLVGHHDWIECTTLFTSFGGVQLDVRSRGSWQTSVTMTARMSYNGSPFTYDFELDLGHGGFRLVGSSNVGFVKPLSVTELLSN